MRCGYGSATVMVAAPGVAQDRFIKRTAQGIAAVMGAIAVGQPVAIAIPVESTVVVPRVK